MELRQLRPLADYKLTLNRGITMQCTGALVAAGSKIQVNVSCPVIAGVIPLKSVCPREPIE